jgi:hypothetical protein
MIGSMRAAALVLFAAVASAAAAPPAASRGQSVKDLVAAASRYVQRYQQEFQYLLADEDYSQARTIITRDQQTREETRNLRSELFLTFIPADNEWMAVRDVITVDGRPVPDRDNLQRLLSQRGEVRGLIKELIARNARYNIGVVERNFNEPTLPLLLLDQKRVGDVRFERKETTTGNGAALSTLAFTERGRPTLVRGPSGSLFARGEVVLEAATGIVRRTSFDLAYEVRHATIKVRLVTDYALDPKLGLWLPSLFTERYDTSGEVKEVVFCQARYTNYRRFDVAARIRR